MKYLSLILLALFAVSCNDYSQEPTADVAKPQSHKVFEAIATNYNVNTVALPEGMTYDVLYVGGLDKVKRADGASFAAKEYADYITYIPIEGSSEHGYLYVNQETKGWNADLGDGGGGTLIEIVLQDGKWAKANEPQHIDFSTVGGTLRNCGGFYTKNNTILTAEETEPSSNASLYEDFGDTADYNGLPRYMNFGFMVEVDPFSGKAIQKLLAMGRYEHEDVHVMDDNQTIYLTDDHSPGALFKFVADVPGVFSAGQLLAFQAGDDGAAGKWLPIPRDTASLLNAREVAFQLGATAFTRHEWIDGYGDKLYITETGSSEFFSYQAVYELGATPAPYRENCCYNPSTELFHDPYGRVLELDINTLQMRVLIEGGDIEGALPGNFANPDAMTVAVLGGIPFLVLNEDLTGNGYGRVGAITNEDIYNEVYFLDLTLENPTIEDLQRFLSGAKGSETTGSAFTPDGKTYFVSIQHPAADNPEPFNHTVVIAVQGFNF